jgi:hypothetical protein
MDIEKLINDALIAEGHDPVSDFNDYCEVDEALWCVGEKVDELDYDEHRWYITSTIVYKVGDTLIGAIHYNMKGECGDPVDDLGAEACIFEMEEYTTVSYRVKK